MAKKIASLALVIVWFYVAGLAVAFGGAWLWTHLFILRISDTIAYLIGGGIWTLAYVLLATVYVRSGDWKEDGDGR